MIIEPQRKSAASGAKASRLR